MIVNYCGVHAIHSKGFKIYRPNGSNDYLFLHMKAPTRFYFQDRNVVARNNEILLYKKDSPQIFEGVEDTHVDDFMHFQAETPDDVAFLDQLCLKYDSPMRINNLQALLEIHQNICFEYMSQKKHKDDAINYLLKYFLIKLEEAMNEEQNSPIQNDIISNLYRLRIEIYSSPDKKWTVSNMASKVNLSPSYFQAMYKKVFHVSCGSDLIESRLIRAKQMLQYASNSIGEIASYCGYESESYFSRHFRSITGFSPSEYRRLNINDTSENKSSFKAETES